MKSAAAALVSIALCVAATAPVRAVEAGAANADKGKKPPGRTQPAHTKNAAPDRTGSIARSQAAPQTSGVSGVAKPADEALFPFYLPDAARPRMHACGDTWRAKKMSGDTGTDDWRDFAVKCLAGTDAPSGP